MRLIGLLFAAAAAASMLAAPALADPANPAANLSLTNTGSDNGSGSLVNSDNGSSSDVRAGAKTKRSSNFVFTTPMIILGLAVAGGAIGAAVASSSSDSNPASA